MEVSGNYLIDTLVVYCLLVVYNWLFTKTHVTKEILLMLSLSVKRVLQFIAKKN